MAEENLDADVLSELDNIIQNGSNDDLIDYDKKVRKQKKKERPKANAAELEKNTWIANVVDETISDGYIYSGAERQTQQAEAWRRYFRERYGNETEGYSEYVSPMILHQVNTARAVISEQYFRNSAPLVKFTPDSAKDIENADNASDYVNYLFRHKLDGHSIIDQTIFNAALLKICPVRVYSKEVRSKEPICFENEDKADVIEEKLAAFIVANDLSDKEAYEVIEEPKDDDMLYVCYKWASDEIVEKYPYVEVISPENFFISRQAESLESAKVVSKITNMKLSDIKEMFPDAPKLNGFGKKDEMRFWEELQSDYQTWYSETTWFAKWSHDSLQYFEQYDNQNDESAGLGTKELFVVDAEIYLDPDDSGDAKLCHIIKAGNHLLYKKEISERSFLCGSLIPTANRWLGISLWDMLEQEAREETTLTRAFTDSAVRAAHPNIAFDPGVYESDDVYNLGPDTVVRAIEGAAPQQGVAPLEVIKMPGPDASVQAAIQHFKAQGSEITGIGSGLQGASASDISDMRLDKDTAAAAQTNSAQFLNYLSRNYANFICKLHVKILNTAIKSGATPALLKIQDSWNEIDPISLKPRADFVLNIDIGVSEKQEKLQKVQGIMQAVGILTGQPGPDGQTLGIQAELLPTAGYELGKLMLEAHGAKELTDAVFLNPKTVEDPQVQAAIQGALAKQAEQFNQQMAMMQQQITDQVKLELNTAEKQKEAEIKEREVMLKEREQDFKEDQAAFDVATKDIAEERRSDEDAYKEGSRQRELDIKEKDVDNKHTENMKKLELEAKEVARAPAPSKNGVNTVL